MKKRTRRINHTQRLRITRDRVKLKVTSNDSDVLVAASVNLEGLKIEGSAQIFLDISRKAQSQRFLLGTVDAPRPLEFTRTRFDDPVGLRFDVVVVGAEDSLLLAAARRVPPEDSLREESLLPVRSSPDLGQRVWRLDLDDVPFLEINNSIPGWRELVDDFTFQAAVLPEVVARIVELLVKRDIGSERDDDEDEPLAAWLQFVEQLGIDLESVDSEDHGHLAAEVASEFANRHGFAKRLAASERFGGES